MERISDIVFDSYSRFFLDSIFIFLFEISGQVSALLLCFSRIFWFDKNVNNIVGWILLLVNPMFAGSSILYWIVLLCVSFVVVFFVSMLFFVVYYLRVTNSFTKVGLVVLLRLLRTILFFPIMSVLLYGLKCNYWSDLNFVDFEERCDTFPNIVFVSLGLFVGVVLFTITTFEAFFFQDQYISIHMITASPHGRYSVLMNFTNMLLILTNSLLHEEVENEYLVLLGFGILISAIFFNHILLIRFIPFYSVNYVFILSIFQMTKLTFLLTAFVNTLTNSWNGVFMMFCFPVLIVSSFLILCLRYFLLSYVFKRKDYVLKNAFVNLYATDFAIGSYQVIYPTKACQCMDRLFLMSCCFRKGEKKKMKMKKSMKQSGEREFLGMAKIAESAFVKFSRSREVFITIIPLVFSNKHILYKLMNYIGFLKQTSPWDYEVTYQVFRGRMSRSFQVSEENETKKKTGNILYSISKREKRLDRDLVSLFSELSNETKISFRKLPQIFSSMHDNISFCEKKFSCLLKKYPSEETFRRFAAFLTKYNNDPNSTGEILKVSENFKKIVRFRSTDEDMQEMPDDKLHVPSGNQASQSFPSHLHRPPRRMSMISFSELQRKSGNDRDRRNSDVSTSFSRSIFDESEKLSYGLSLTSSRSSHRSIMSRLKEKIRKNNHLSVRFLKLVCCSLFVLCLLLIIASFASIVAFQSEVDNSMVLLKTASRIRKSTVSSALQLRKLQTSSYPYPETYFLHERNTTSFRERALDSCHDIKYQLGLLYQESFAETRPYFHKTYDFASFKFDNGTILYQTFSLLDGVFEYEQRCVSILRLSDDDYANRVEGERLEDNPDFAFVILSEKLVYDYLTELFSCITDVFENRVLNFQFLFLSFPFLVFFSLPFLLCGCCCYDIQQKFSFRKLLFIPLEEIVRMRGVFSESQQQGGSVLMDGGGGRKMVIIGAVTAVQRFFVLQACFILVLVVMLLPVSIISYIASNVAKQRNREYDYTLRISASVTRVHLWAVELMYRDDSLFDIDMAQQELQDGMDTLNENFEDLRFGNNDQLEGNDDSGDEIYDIYYEDTCDDDLLYSQVVDADDNGTDISEDFRRLDCLSLSGKVSEYIRNAEYLLSESLGTTGNTTLATLLEMRKSNEYETLILLENVSSGDIQNEGAFTSSLERLESVVVNMRVTEYASIMSYFLLFFGLPIFLCLFPLILLPWPGRLHGILNQVPRIFLLLNLQFLSDSYLFDEIIGDVGLLGRLDAANHSKRKKKKNSRVWYTTRFTQFCFPTRLLRRLFCCCIFCCEAGSLYFNEEVKSSNTSRLLDMLKTSKLSVVAFNMKGDIVQYNAAADEMFGFKFCDHQNFLMFFTPQSRERIVKWARGRKGFLGSLLSNSPPQNERKKKNNRVESSSSPNEKNEKKSPFPIRDLMKEKQRRRQSLISNFQEKEYIKKNYLVYSNHSRSLRSPKRNSESSRIRTSSSSSLRKDDSKDISNGDLDLETAANLRDLSAQMTLGYYQGGMSQQHKNKSEIELELEEEEEEEEDTIGDEDGRSKIRGSSTSCITSKRSEECGNVLETFATLSRDKFLVIGIFEGMEGAWRKKNLLENILPKEIASRLTVEEIMVRSNNPNEMIYYQDHKSASAIFSDICNFSKLSSDLGSKKLIQFLHRYISGIDDMLDLYHITKIKTTGDGYMAVSGIPTYDHNHAVDAVEFALEMKNFTKKFEGIDIRVGIASGRIFSAILGKKRWSFDVFSSVVNEAARMEQLGVAGSIQVSRTTYEHLFNKGYVFLERKIHVQGFGVVSAYSFVSKEEGFIYLPNRKKEEEEEIGAQVIDSLMNYRMVEAEMENDQNNDDDDDEGEIEEEDLNQLDDDDEEEEGEEEELMEEEVLEEEEEEEESVSGSMDENDGEDEEGSSITSINESDLKKNVSEEVIEIQERERV